MPRGTGRSATAALSAGRAGSHQGSRVFEEPAAAVFCGDE